MDIRQAPAFRLHEQGVKIAASFLGAVQLGNLAGRSRDFGRGNATVRVRGCRPFLAFFVLRPLYSSSNAPYCLIYA